VMLSSVGLPTTNGFIGEFMAMMGAFVAAFAGAFGLNIAYSVLAGTGVILAAVYLQVMYMKVFYGPNDNPENQRLRDLKPWEIGLVGSLVLFIFWGGMYPNTFLKPMETSVNAVRLMALNEAGKRPSWATTEMEIDEKGNLLAVQRREPNQLQSFSPKGMIAPANQQFKFVPETQVPKSVGPASIASEGGH